MRITRKSFPQIYWKGDWRYICYTKFTENEYGANLFCQKLGYPSGKFQTSNINASLPIHSDKHDEDTFLMGGCRINDIWPDCTGLSAKPYASTDSPAASLVRSADSGPGELV